MRSPELWRRWSSGVNSGTGTDRIASPGSGTSTRHRPQTRRTRFAHTQPVPDRTNRPMTNTCTRLPHLGHSIPAPRRATSVPERGRTTLPAPVNVSPSEQEPKADEHCTGRLRDRDGRRLLALSGWVAGLRAWGRRGLRRLRGRGRRRHCRVRGRERRGPRDRLIGVGRIKCRKLAGRQA